VGRELGSLRAEEKFEPAVELEEERELIGRGGGSEWYQVN